MKNHKYFLLISAIFLSSHALALPEDFQQKIEIEADRVFLDKTKGNAIYEGNVIVKQGTILIEADNLTITTVKKGTQQFNDFLAVGTDGKLAKFQQQLDVEGNMIFGQGNKIFYNTDDSILEITGNGEVKRTQDIITADSIKYFMKTDIFEAKKENTGRVSMTLQPEEDQ